MTKRALRATLTGAFVALSLGFAACGDDSDSSSDSGDGSEEPVVIGYAAGLTGDAAVGDVPSSQGAEFAVDEINADGGVDGHELELIVKDIETDPKLGGVVTQELLDSGADVLLGCAFVACNVPTIQAGAAEGVPTVLVNSTEPSNANAGGSTAYFTAFGDNQQAAAAAEYALDEGYESAATASSPDLAYLNDTPKWFAEVFEEGGGEVAGDVTYNLGQQDFTSVVSRLKDLDPDVIYTTMIMPDIPVFLKALRAAGVDAAVIGGDGFESPELIKSAGDAAEGVVFTRHGFPQDGSKFEEVLAGVTEEFGQPESEGFVGVGYDAIQLIKAAIEEADSTEPEDIEAALAELEDVEGVTGSITLAGTDGIPVKPVALSAVENGEFVFVDEFVPENVPEP